MLNLYENITPNHTSTHYIFSVFSSYLNMLNSFKLKEITPNNYTIDNLFIRCKLDETLTLSNYKNVTYIINTEDEICYFVNSAQVKSGYVYYSLSVDNWGTYLHKASLKDILIKRCNRKLSDNGIYDTIASTKDTEIIRIGTELHKEDLALLFIYSAGVEGTNNQALHYGVSLLHDTGIYDYGTMSELMTNLTATNIAKDEPEGTSTYPLTIKNVYLLPKEIIPFNQLNPRYFTREGWVNLFKVYNLSRYGTYTKEITYNTDINKKVELGSMGGNIHELKLTSTTQKISYYFCLNANSFKAYVFNGNNQNEITSSFEIPLISKDNTQATTEISTTLRYILGASQIGIGVFGGSPLSLVKGLSTIGRNYEDEINRQNKAPIINSITGGNAGITYNHTFNSEINNSPYIMFSSTSLVNEEKHTRKLGATFNEYVDTLTEIYSKELLGTGTETDDTYISADMEISNIPLDAISDITGKFSNGVNTQLL